MNIIKRVLEALILTFFLSTVAYTDVIDRVVAIVNDDVITLSEVNIEGKALLKKIAENVSPSERSEALKQARQKIIEKLIDKKIMHQEAKKANISVTEEDVDLAYQSILDRNRITKEIFQEQLAAMDMDPEQYREELKTQVLSSKLVNFEIRSKVIIPEDKIIDYYDTHYTERVGEGGFYLLQIGIGWDEKAPKESGIPTSREIAQQRAEQVRNMAIKENDFRELAKQYSNLPSSVDGGDIGVLKGEDMSSLMFETISKTKAGGISPIIETSSVFQFFKVLSSQEGQIVTKVPYNKVKDEIYEILYQEEMESRYEKWLQEIKNKAYIKIL